MKTNYKIPHTQQDSTHRHYSYKISTVESSVLWSRISWLAVPSDGAWTRRFSRMRIINAYYLTDYATNGACIPTVTCFFRLNLNFANRWNAKYISDSFENIFVLTSNASNIENPTGTKLLENICESLKERRKFLAQNNRNSIFYICQRFLKLFVSINHYCMI